MKGLGLIFRSRIRSRRWGRRGRREVPREGIKPVPNIRRMIERVFGRGRVHGKVGFEKRVDIFEESGRKERNVVEGIFGSLRAVRPRELREVDFEISINGRKGGIF